MLLHTCDSTLIHTLHVTAHPECSHLSIIEQAYDMADAGSHYAAHVRLPVARREREGGGEREGEESAWQTRKARQEERSHMFLLHVSPPRLQFLPGANDRPSLPLMPHASSGVATQEIVKPRGFIAPLLDIIKALLQMTPACTQHSSEKRAFEQVTVGGGAASAFKKQTEF
jgi:hypothetical protein